MIEPLLYELHDLARSRGVEGYRRMSKTELLEVVGEVSAGGPTTVERSVRRGLGLLTLRGGTPENTLALETLEDLAEAVEELAADEEVRLSRSPVPEGGSSRRAPTSVPSPGFRARRSRAAARPRSTASPRSTCRPWPC